MTAVYFIGEPSILFDLAHVFSNYGFFFEWLQSMLSA